MTQKSLTAWTISYASVTQKSFVSLAQFGCETTVAKGGIFVASKEVKDRGKFGGEG